MKTQTRILLAIAAFSAMHLCSCSGEDGTAQHADTTDVRDSVNNRDTAVHPAEVTKLEAAWTYDDMNSIAVRTGKAKIDTLTPVQLIEFFNATYTDSLQLEYRRIGSDTLFVRVLNADFLTQRSGSTGAQAYLTVGTFTLTESPRINYVNFDFEEGDHAVPGTYSRRYWYDRAEANRKLNEKR